MAKRQSDPYGINVYVIKNLLESNLDIDWKKYTKQDVINTVDYLIKKQQKMKKKIDKLSNETYKLERKIFVLEERKYGGKNEII